MLLRNLLDLMLVKDVKGSIEAEVKDVVYDSRRSQAGSIFVCLPGFKSDGHEYINDALQRGAAAIVTEREIDRPHATVIRVPQARVTMALLATVLNGFPSGKLKVVGVTGTNGKTTTTHLIDALMEEKYNLTGMLGTIRYKLGKETVPVQATTPEAPDFQSYLAGMAAKGVGCVTMEVSSHALDQSRVAGCEFDIAVLTNITEDHLDYHRTFERYRAAKGKLFSQLGSSFYKGDKLKAAVINRDDKNFEYIASQTDVQQITYGINTFADLNACCIRTREDGGISFHLKSFAGEEDFNLRLTGMFSIYNSMAAIAVGLVEGLPLPLIRRVLEDIRGIPGRFEAVEAGQGFTIIVDYAHTPDGLENVLRTIREFARQRVITVFGCGGDRDRSKRPEMGEIAGRYSDFCIVTNDNPRTEDPEQIVSEILPGLEQHMDPRHYRVELNRYKALQLGLKEARPGDVVLIAGKGHEDYQVFKDRTVYFSDRQAVTEILNRGKNKCS